MYGYKNLFDRVIKTTAKDDLESVGVDLKNLNYIKETILGKKYYKDIEEEIVEKIKVNEEKIVAPKPKVHCPNKINSLSALENILNKNQDSFLLPESMTTYSKYRKK